MSAAEGERTILVTGATSGIGRATALGLAERGCDLVLLARNAARGEQVAAEARQAGAAHAEALVCDLSAMSSVRAAAAEFQRRRDRLAVLINDAAVFLGERRVTSEGHEVMFATNHLGPFLLTNLLLSALVAGAPSRVINVTAPSTSVPDLDDLDSERRFRSAGAFGRTKAENLLFTFALARRLEGKGVSVFAVHPGVTRTPLMRNASAPMRALGRIFNLTARTPEEASRGLVELALSPAFEGMTGRFLHDGRPLTTPFSGDLDSQERLWAESARLVDLAE